MRRAPALALLAVLVVVLVAAGRAAAYGPGATASALAREMRQGGSASGALVVDLDSGREVYALRPDVRRVPGSVNKLYTTAASLIRLGADDSLRTQALAVEPLDLDGRLDGDLHLRGGGDPTLSLSGLRALAADLVTRAGLSEVGGRVVGDESVFDTLRGPPSSAFRISAYVEPLGALMVNRGRTGRARPYYQSRPPRWAANEFAKALRLHGVKVVARAAAGVTPPGALPLSSRRSPPMARLVRLANVTSDNYIAEMLLKALGATGEDAGTTARGATVVRRTLADQIGIRPVVVDGSGLSRANRTSPRDVVDLLTAMHNDDAWPSFRDSLAVAGRTGTLKDRVRRSVARDRCRGKTGTLASVSAVAGYCDATGGSTVAFAILMNGVYPPAARTRQDRMLSLLARYDPD